MFRLPEKESRAYMAALGERLRPMDTAAFARRLLDRVARNHCIIVIPGSWQFDWWLDRLFPALGSYLARKVFAAMIVKHRATVILEIQEGQIVS